MTSVELRPRSAMPSMDEPHSFSAHQVQETVEQEVARLSRTIIDFLNARDFSNPWFKQNVSENVRCDVPGEVTIGLHEFVRQYQVGIVGPVGSSRFHVMVGNITVLVDEKQRSATSLLTQYMSQYRSDERRMAGNILFHWTWDPARKRWICQSCKMMYGTPVFFTDDVYATD